MFKWLKARRERRRQFNDALMERMQVTTNLVLNVSETDIQRIIRRDFSDADPDAVNAALEAWTLSPAAAMFNPHEVKAAILKLSNGDHHRIDEFVQLAGQDARSVLSMAHMPEFSRLVPGLPVQEFVKIPVEEVKAVAQQDHELYVNWLAQDES